MNELFAGSRSSVKVRVMVVGGVSRTALSAGSAVSSSACPSAGPARAATSSSAPTAAPMGRRAMRAGLTVPESSGALDSTPGTGSTLVAGRETTGHSAARPPRGARRSGGAVTGRPAVSGPCPVVVCQAQAAWRRGVCGPARLVAGDRAADRDQPMPDRPAGARHQARPGRGLRPASRLGGASWTSRTVVDAVAHQGMDRGLVDGLVHRVGPRGFLSVGCLVLRVLGTSSNSRSGRNSA